MVINRFRRWQGVMTSNSVDKSCALKPSQTGDLINPLDSKGTYSATWNNTKLVHWPLMGGLLHWVQLGEEWAGPQPAQTPPRCTKCRPNSPPINGQCTNHRIAV